MASIFSGSSGRNAAVASNRELLGGLQNAHQQLASGNTAAAGYLNQNPNIYNSATDRAQGLLDSAYADAKGSIAGNSQYFQPFYDTGQQANTALANANGLNGAAGYNDAMAQFRTGPGYQFQMDQGLDAINRTAAARGGLASGNNTVDLLRYAQGNADQSWQQNINNLSGMSNTGMQAAQGLAQANQGLANLAMNYGNSGASLQQGLGDRLAGNNTALAGNETNMANNLANMTYGAANQMSQNTGQGMMAGQQAASNRFGFGMGLANSLLGAAGKFI